MSEKFEREAGVIWSAPYTEAEMKKADKDTKKAMQGVNDIIKVLRDSREVQPILRLDLLADVARRVSEK